MDASQLISNSPKNAHVNAIMCYKLHDVVAVVVSVQVLFNMPKQDLSQAQKDLVLHLASLENCSII